MVLGLLEGTGAAMTQLANRSLDYQVTYQRAVQAVLWGMPAVSMVGFRKHLDELGVGYNDVIYFSKPVEPRHELITANNQTPYVVSIVDTRGGPVVVDVPAASANVALFGSAIDSWQVPLVDFGPAGEDAGKGGKYLFLPPGHTGAPPSDYVVVPAPTYFVHIALCPILRGQGTNDDAVATSRRLKVYPLAQANNPGTRYVDGYAKTWHTLPNYDLGYFRDLASIVNDEPAQGKDAAMLGMLASIGIEKGKLFNPTGDTARAFEQAAQDAYAMMQEYLVTPGKGFEPQWPHRQWGGPRLTESEDFTFLEQGKLLVDERAAIFFFATFLPKKLGKASAYLTAYRDDTGKLFEGAKSYRFRVPANVPVTDFWSVIAYSMKTKAFIYNPLNRVGLSSYDRDKLQMNADGSIDLYFGPKAPAGSQANWVPTQGEDFFLIFRLYGPKTAFFEKTWKLPDVEEVGRPKAASTKRWGRARNAIASLMRRRRPASIRSL